MRGLQTKRRAECPAYPLHTFPFAHRCVGVAYCDTGRLTANAWHGATHSENWDS